MGSILGLCSMASWIPCLCGSALCLLCRCCPSGNNSTVTRYEPSREIKSQWTAVWVKIFSSWIGTVLYVWTLVAPLVLTNRDFD